MREEITIERMGYGDAAIGRASSGKTVFVDGGCPGDVALVDMTADKGSYLEGRVAELVSPSPDRALPSCPLAGVCGGCGWQHLSYERQLAEKRAGVVSQLSRVGGVDARRAEELVAACVPSKRPMGYRNKLEFACRTGQNGFELGFHRKGADDIVAIDACPLAHKQIEKSAKAIRGALRYMSGREDLGIHRVGVRHSHRTGALEVALWTLPGAFPRAAVARTLSQAVRGVTSVVRVMTADESSARKLKGVEVLDGKGIWLEEVAGVRHGVSAPSFFQVNTAQADTLVKLTLDGLELGEDDLAADLYCGVGTFTLPLAERCDAVYAVESYGSSVRDLRRTVERMGMADAVEVIGGDAARELPELGELDALIVDPPRAGLAKEIVGSIAAAGPARMAYISCDPATWARDVARLSAAGFELVRATPVDLFPQTYHVEVASILRNTRR